MVKLELSEEEAKPLVLAATGQAPYFIMVNEKEQEFLVTVTEGFNIGALFRWLAMYARENKEFKASLTDFIIDLSKEV